ncbi:TPR-like protein [Auriscalpium vulgare]|uniref:TPR-like protein n=1 Tax=Auriscalpium vulgare TaxID=40419 RepID=A0ACB8S5W0_9AGAM|nr:TPR-like protein [Auriscalpium vulgare]
MSLQGLMSGADCAIDSNPLSQVLKHTDGDHSLQQDRLAGPSSSRLHHLPSTSMQAAAEHDMAMARHFFESQQQNTPGPSFSAHPELIAHQVRLMEAARSAPHTPGFSNAWADVQRAGQAPTQSSGMAKAWAGDAFLSCSVLGDSLNSLVAAQQQQQPSYTFAGPSTTWGTYGSMGAFPQTYGQGFNASISALQEQGKGKERLKESDFEEAFAQITSSLHPVQKDSSVADTAARLAELEKDMGAVQIEDPQATTDTAGQSSSFKEVWEQLRNSDLPPPSEDMAKWEAEFNQLMNSQREESEFDYGGAMQEAWAANADDMTDTFGDSMKFDHEGIPLLEPYTFDPNNKYLDPSSSTRSPLAEAKSLLEHNGSLSEAALLLEAAIQKGELGEGGYEAWILLGECRNMDEREEAGMKALTEGVRLAEAAGAAGAGMLSLAISYTNESFDRGSYSMLHRWLRARFPEVPVSQETVESLSQTQWHSHTLVTEAFLAVARAQHAQGIMDPDVQIALGVLSYTNGNYDRAKDCFEAALSARPKDYLLWNRLGSSLSNGNKPEESLGAYREALALRPTYTRAIYNVGVACLNIGASKEAAEHFLSALSMQESTGGEKSEQLWLTLSRALIAMDRKDLADLSKSRPSLETFRANGFEF